MCFSGTPSYTKKEYGPLPSLGTGSASKTVTLGSSTPMRGSRSDDSSTMDDAMASARASLQTNDSIGSIRPPTKKAKKNSLLRETYLNITSPFMRG